MVGKHSKLYLFILLGTYKYTNKNMHGNNQLEIRVMFILGKGEKRVVSRERKTQNI